MISRLAAGGEATQVGFQGSLISWIVGRWGPVEPLPPRHFDSKIFKRMRFDLNRDMGMIRSDLNRFVSVPEDCRSVELRKNERVDLDPAGREVLRCGEGQHLLLFLLYSWVSIGWAVQNGDLPFVL
jgi:hypothetical protein